jgi:hypothetical protein
MYAVIVLMLLVVARDPGTCSIGKYSALCIADKCSVHWCNMNSKATQGFQFLDIQHLRQHPAAHGNKKTVTVR